ncbi:GNAT family N-acetyltransferase [Nocardia sp. CNY236]|uniref:GNAT family N-acetyltransferase n=1 Tax=Nocardia sp. CNY236 TaxID=1169152 RepID=UPI000411CC76|nr:GNAT family N-acetyltransferase [Nocardia sp. CNY236]
MPSTIRDATESDLPGCVRVLSEAFADDPVTTAIWPDQQGRYRALPKYFAAMLHHFHSAGAGVQIGVDHGGHIGAVAVWDPPGQWKRSVARTVRALPDLLPAVGTRMVGAIRVGRTLDRHHPDEPVHWFLDLIGTPVSHRGGGYAAALIEHRVESSPGIGAYLVCTREENITYYQRFGFDVIDPFRLPIGDEPTVWSMATALGSP